MQRGKAENHDGPPSIPSSCLPLTIVADDLTGACDAAVAFARTCNPVRVQISGQTGENSPVHAVTTESRELAAEESELRVRNIVERLPPDTELFKKVDSVFRGNTVAEIAATLRYARFDFAIIAPAYPALGRTLNQGILKICDPIGSRMVPVADLLAEAGCELGHLAADQSTEALASSLQQYIAGRARAVVCDASTQVHLTQIVRAARALGKHVLWIGSGGLAHALAAELPVLPTHPTKPRSGPTIFFVGSPHPVSRAQIDHLRQIAGIVEHRSVHPISSTQEDILVSVELGRTTPEEIRRALAAHDPAQIGCLFMTGGDTAHFVCRALEIDSLRLLHEFAPGVPVALGEGGRFDGVPVVLKSGGFGEPNLLCRLLEAHRASHEVIA